MCTFCDSTGLFEMVVGVLTPCHTQYCKFLLHNLQVVPRCMPVSLPTTIHGIPKSTWSILHGQNDHVKFIALCF